MEWLLVMEHAAMWLSRRKLGQVEIKMPYPFPVHYGIWFHCDYQTFLEFVYVCFYWPISIPYHVQTTVEGTVISRYNKRFVSDRTVRHREDLL